LFVEAFPVCTILCAPLLPITSPALRHDRLDARSLGIINADGNQRASTLHTFGVDMGFITTDAGTGQ